MGWFEYFLCCSVIQVNFQSQLSNNHTWQDLLFLNPIQDDVLVFQNGSLTVKIPVHKSKLLTIVLGAHSGIVCCVFELLKFVWIEMAMIYMDI